MAACPQRGLQLAEVPKELADLLHAVYERITIAGPAIRVDPCRHRHARPNHGGLSANERPVTMDRARLERQVRELAMEHAAARLDDAEYLARMARLRGDLEIVEAQPARDLPARRATEWLDALAETWQKADLVEEKSDVIHAI
jgi:hypothetical protein